MNFLTSLVRRIPGASVRTTCLGINKKTGKKCTNVACGDTGYCERHISQHPNFSALSGGGGEMMVCEPVVKKQKIAPTQQDFEDEEEAFKELDNYHLRGIPE